MLLKDFVKSEEINHFSQESKDLITERYNNEIFEIYETSSKGQCPDCALYWEIGIVYCTCGKCMQPTARNLQYNKDRYDALSIPGYVIKKNQSRGPRMYHKARDMLRKAKLPKNGSCKQYDALALEDHSYEATSEERRRWEKNWKIFYTDKENKVR